MKPFLAVLFLLATPVLGDSMSRIEALLVEGKIDEAIAVGRTAVADAPKDADLRLVLARSLANKAKRLEGVLEATLTEEAIATGNVTVKGDPTDIRVVYEPALFEEALLHLNQGIRHAPERSDLRLELCFLLTDAGRIERARKALAETIEKVKDDPEYLELLVSFGAERTLRGDAQGGAALLGLVAEAFPEEAEVQADYGFTLTRLGRKNAALAAMDRAAELAPADLRLQRMRATAAMLLRDFERATQAFDAAAALSLEDSDRVGAAAAAYGVGHTLGRERLIELAAHAPSADPASVQLSRIFLDATAQGPRGESLVELASQLVQNDQTILLAMPFLHQILRVRPADPSARTMLATLYRKMGCNPLAEQLNRPSP